MRAKVFQDHPEDWERVKELFGWKERFETILLNMSEIS